MDSQCQNTDMVIATDDAHSMRLVRLFNEPLGREYLVENGVPAGIVENLDLLGISGIANVLSSIKFAKYYELTDQDIVMTVLTDSMELYGSRLAELREQHDDFYRQHGRRGRLSLERASKPFLHGFFAGIGDFERHRHDFAAVHIDRRRSNATFRRRDIELPPRGRESWRI